MRPAPASTAPANVIAVNPIAAAVAIMREAEAKPAIFVAPAAEIPVVTQAANPIAASSPAEIAAVDVAPIAFAPRPVAIFTTDAVVAPIAEVAPVETVAVTPTAAPAIIVAAPDVAAEPANDIAAPQYGIGLQLFDPVPEESIAAIPADNDGDSDGRNA